MHPAPTNRAKSPAQSPRPAVRPLDHGGLDAGWDRRLAKGMVPPDATIDLHGDTLDAAYARLDGTLAQAVAQGARLVLVIAGKHREPPEYGADPAAVAGGGKRRGVIRAKLLDWLAGSAHATRIATVRPAHPRHGGAGAVYVVLKRAR